MAQAAPASTSRRCRARDDLHPRPRHHVHPRPHPHRRTTTPAHRPSRPRPHPGAERRTVRRRGSCGVARGGAVGDCRTSSGGDERRGSRRVADRKFRFQRASGRTSRLLRPLRVSSVKCGARTSRNRRAAASRRCSTVRLRFGYEHCPPTRAACRRILSLTPRQYAGAAACWRPSSAPTFTVRRSGVSRDGLEGVPNERTAPQTAWKPRRPLRWRRLPATLARSTRRAFSWRPLRNCALGGLHIGYTV